MPSDTRSMVVSELADENTSLRKRLANIREKAGETGETLMGAGAALAAAAAAGYAEGRYPAKNFFGATAGEALGGALLAVGLFKVAGKQSSLATSAGIGALCHAAGRRGYAKGVEAAKEAPAKDAAVSGSVHNIRSQVEAARRG